MKVLEHKKFQTAADLIAAIQRLGAGIALDAIYLKDAEGNPLNVASLEQEKLSDGSLAFNLVLADEGWTMFARELVNGRTLTLERDRTHRNWRMRGGWAGEHTLTDSGEERARAHWAGYREGQMRDVSLHTLIGRGVARG